MALTKWDGKKEVRFIALLVAIIWGTYSILNVVVLTSDPSIPQSLDAIRVCKGNYVDLESIVQGQDLEFNELSELGKVFFVYP